MILHDLEETAILQQNENNQASLHSYKILGIFLSIRNCGYDDHKITNLFINVIHIILSEHLYMYLMHLMIHGRKKLLIHPNYITL